MAQRRAYSGMWHGFISKLTTHLRILPSRCGSLLGPCVEDIATMLTREFISSICDDCHPSVSSRCHRSLSIIALFLSSLSRCVCVPLVLSPFLILSCSLSYSPLPQPFSDTVGHRQVIAAIFEVLSSSKKSISLDVFLIVMLLTISKGFLYLYDPYNTDASVSAACSLAVHGSHSASQTTTTTTRGRDGEKERWRERERGGFT